jgi:hypothetical protein
METEMKAILIAAAALLMASAPAYAITCYERPVITADNAPVNREKIVAAGSNGNLGGTAYTKATFCPAAAAAGTCTGESLSEKVNNYLLQYVTYDGNVPDTEEYRKGIFIGPIFIGTPWKPGSC